MNSLKRALLGLAAAVLLAADCSGQAAADTAKRRPREKNSGEWALYAGNHSGWHYSPLEQIGKNNVGKLKLAWKLETGLFDAFEAVPIVTGGVMYFSTPYNHVYAVDARTGKPVWTYVHKLPTTMPLCCGAVNRGVGVGGGRVMMATLDAHLIALDQNTGNLAWDVKLAEPSEGYSATSAPQVIGDMALIGISGGDFGARGFVDAYDIATGKRVWRHWNVPGPGEFGNDTWQGDSWKTGGAPAWMPFTWDKDLDLIYIGTGNPGPDLDGADRTGDNLFTECIVALDRKTGKRKWHFQTMPHDVWDFDNVTEPILDDVKIKGQPVKALFSVSKNGYFYALDRTSGKFLYATRFVDNLNWGSVDNQGQAHYDDDKKPRKDEWVEVWPGAAGGKEWCPAAYDPVRKLAFIPVIECGHYHKLIEQEFRPGLLYWGGVSKPVPGKAYGQVVAIDVETGKVAWRHQTKYPVVAGVLATKSGLVITGTPDRELIALDADSGKKLWSYTAVSGWHSSPIMYELDGREYLAFANGWGGWVAGFGAQGTPELEGLPFDNAMYVFTLPE